MKLFCAALAFMFIACTTTAPRPFTLDYDTPVDRALQQRLEEIDASLREKHGMSTGHAAVGVLDLRRPRVAMAPRLAMRTVS